MAAGRPQDGLLRHLMIGVFALASLRSVAATRSSPETTEWKLTALGGNPVVLEEKQQAPSLTLLPEQMRAVGYGGCNRFTGSYVLAGEKLKFGTIAGTMMACLKGMDFESAFHQALPRVASWKINGQGLD